MARGPESVAYQVAAHYAATFRLASFPHEEPVAPREGNVPEDVVVLRRGNFDGHVWPPFVRH